MIALFDSSKRRRLMACQFEGVEIALGMRDKGLESLRSPVDFGTIRPGEVNKPFVNFDSRHVDNNRSSHNRTPPPVSPDNWTLECILSESATTGLCSAAVTEVAFRTSGLTVSFGGAA